MLYAVVGFSGKQFRVTNNSKLTIDRTLGNVGDKILPTRVYMTIDEGQVEKETQASISAIILSHPKAAEKIIFKKRRRHGYQRKRGCRQPMTEIQIKIEKENQI